MSASPGRSLLLRVKTDGTTFVTAGGLRSKQVKRNVDKVDVTTADSAGRWQDLLPGAAVQSLSFQANDFVWLNDAAYQAFKAAFEGGTFVVCQIVYPGSGYYQGDFVVTQLDDSADHDKEITSALTLDSSAQPLWTTGGAAMIRAARSEPARTAVNSLRGEFTTSIAGEPVRFDTRLSTVAAIEESCGDRAIVEVLNEVILGRKARSLIPLIAAALQAAEPGQPDAEARAARASVDEAEAFVLALIFALGFTVAPGAGEARRQTLRALWTTRRLEPPAEFALGCLRWSEQAFWDCSWLGFADAWAGYHRFVLGVDPAESSVSRDEALRLERGLQHWRRTGEWTGDHDG